MSRNFIRLLLTVLLFSALAHAAGRVECGVVPSKAMSRGVPYCAVLPPSYDTSRSARYPILYFLHGLGDNEQSFINTGAWNVVERLWKSGEIGEFIIVTPGGGRSFYINSFDGRAHYEDFFLREFMPAVETKYRVRAGRASRAIGGISMGGYGALGFAFLHPDLFVSVTATSAALLTDIPPNLATGGMLNAFGTPVNAAFFKRNNPLTIAETASIGTLKIYFDCGDQDEYGFNEGAEALHKLLLRRKIRHEFHLDPGGHDWRYFAAHLPASLKFHSRALGLTK